MRFDLCASEYDTYAAPQRGFARRVAEFARVQEGQRVLELGAGTGALTRCLCAVPGVRVLATDASAAMVEIGRRAVPQAKWELLDAFETEIPRSALQVSSGLLQWAPNPGHVLRRWVASLEPGGRMVHAFPCDPCLMEWRGIVPEGPVQWRDECAWRELFADARLRVTRHSLWVERHAFDSAHEMLRGLHRSGVTGRARLSSGRLRQSLRAYDRHHRTSRGVIATWAWLALEAVPA